MLDAETVVGSGTMKVTCSGEELPQKLAVVSRGVSPRTAVQILGGILLSAEGGRLMLAATDMELSLRASLEARVEGQGSVVVPGRLLVELARLLPDTEVSIEQRADEGVIHIRSGSFESRLNTYTAEDFPRLPDAEGLERLGVDRDALLETIARVGRTASRDESRPVLTGILVRFEPGKLVMAATDSYRLSVKETALEGTVPELEAIVPARALVELGRIGQGAEQIELGVHENQVVFGVDGIWLTTRRIDGQFPNYKQLVPESFEHEVALPREELLDVVRRIAVMAQRNSPLRLRFAEGELSVSARTQDVGEAQESLPAGFGGAQLEIGFNAEFLRDGTKGFSPRTRTDSSLIRFGQEAARIALAGDRAGSQLELNVVLNARASKRASLNGARLEAAEQLRAEVATLVFTPDRLVVVKGGPAARRAYFDRALGRGTPTQAALPAEYGAALAQRNASLRGISLGYSTREALRPWTERVADLGAQLVAARRDVIAALEPLFAARAGELGLAEAALRYEAEPPSVESLEGRLDRDLDRGATGAGPHLDDIEILAGTRDLRAFGSQGEQRLAVLALLLAEAELVRERRGVPPLLLLDDVLSELDPDRRRILAERLPEYGQALITTTSAAALPFEPSQLVEVVSAEAGTG